MKYLLPFILFSALSTLPLAAQNFEEKKPAQLILKFAPLSFVDLVTPNYHLGLEYRPAESLGLEVNVGIKTPLANSVGNASNVDLFKIREEIRYIFAPRSRIPFYLAFEGFGVWQSFNMVNGNFLDAEGQRIWYEEAEVDRKVAGYTLKYGLLLPSTKSRFGWEMYVGLGIRKVRTHYNIITPRPNTMVFWENFQIFNVVDLNEGPTIKGHFALNIKLTYALL
ncbi:MAG: hypothetical protein WD077_09130 [Bacteroidia bacterium]